MVTSVRLKAEQIKKRCAFEEGFPNDLDSASASGYHPSMICFLVLMSLVAHAEETEPEMLALAGRAYTFERIGTITSFHCLSKVETPECAMLERLDLQPQVDWESLIEKANKKAHVKPGPTLSTSAFVSQTVVDRYGGPWVISLYPRGQAVVPDFPGYRIEVGSGGRIASVDVLRQPGDWKAAAKELGFDEDGKKKKKRRKWLPGGGR